MKKEKSPKKIASISNVSTQVFELLDLLCSSSMLEISSLAEIDLILDVMIEKIQMQKEIVGHIDQIRLIKARAKNGGKQEKTEKRKNKKVKKEKQSKKTALSTVEDDCLFEDDDSPFSTSPQEEEYVEIMEDTPKKRGRKAKIEEYSIAQ